MSAQGRVVFDMVQDLLDRLTRAREDAQFARTERDAYANELACCEQDLRHALVRISELCEQLEQIRGGV